MSDLLKNIAKIVKFREIFMIKIWKKVEKMTVHFSGDVSGDSIPERGELGRSVFCKKNRFLEAKNLLYSQEKYENLSNFLTLKTRIFFVKNL